MKNGISKVLTSGWIRRDFVLISVIEGQLDSRCRRGTRRGERRRPGKGPEWAKCEMKYIIVAHLQKIYRDFES